MVVFFCFVVFHSLKEQSFCFQKGLMIWVPLYLVTYLETSFKSLYFLKKLFFFFKVLNIRSLRMLHLGQCMWHPLCKKKNECTVELACFYRFFFLSALQKLIQIPRGYMSKDVPEQEDTVEKTGLQRYVTQCVSEWLGEATHQDRA